MHNNILSFKQGVGHLGRTDSASLDYLHDTARFSPPWFERLLDGYIAERDRYYTQAWETAKEFYDPALCRKAANPFGALSGVAFDEAGLYDLVAIHPARIRNMMQSSEALSINSHPKILVNPLTPKMGRVAPIFETAINVIWQRDRALMDAMRMAYRECWLTGFAFMLTGYMSQSFKKDASSRRARARFAKSLLGNPLADSVAEIMTQEEALFEDSVDLDEQKPNFEQDSTWVKDSICSKFIPSKMIVFDPEAASVNEAAWIGRTILADHEAVKRDTNLAGTDDLPTLLMKDTEDYQQTRLGVPPMGNGAESGPFRYVCLYEIFHRNDEDKWDLLVMAKGRKQPLRVEKNVYALGNPYSCLSWNRSGEAIFSQSDFEDVKTLIMAERVALRRLHDGVMRSLLDSYILDKSLFPKPQEIQWLITEGIGKIGFAETGHTNKPLQHGVFQFPRTPVSAEVMAYLQMIDRHFQIASGLGPNQLGLPMKSETSATESKNVDDWVRLRGGVKYAAMEDFAADISHKQCQHMAQFFDHDRMGTFAGPEAAAQWAREDFTDGDIQGGLMVKCEQGSMQPQNDEARASFAAEVFGLLKDPVLGPLLAGSVNVPGLLRMWSKARGLQDGNDIVLNVSQKDVADAATKLVLMKEMMNGGGAPPPEAMGGTPLTAGGDAGQSMPMEGG